MSSFGTDDRNVNITFTGRDNASRAMSSIGSSASRTTGVVTKLTTALKYAGIAAATALAAGALLAAKALFDATKAAYYDDIAMKKLAFTQRKAQDATKAQTDATSDLIDKLELATGIADDEMRPAMAALAGTGMSVAKSHDLLNIALDVSVARGKSVQTVSEALAKAYNGQLTGLQRLGVKVTDASGEALTFSEVLDQLRQRFGGAAREAGKTDPLRRLEAAWNQMKEEVGAGLLPVLRQFSEWMIKEGVPWVKKELVPAVKDLGKWIKNNGDTLRSWGNALRGTWEVLRGVWSAIMTVVRAVQSLWRAIKQLFSLDTSFLQDVRIGLLVIQNPLAVLNQMVSQLRNAFYSLYLIALKTTNAILNAVSAAARMPDMPSLPGWLPGVGSAKGGFLRRAQGGMMGRWTLVGEHGPELISNRGYVKTASQTMGANLGGTVNITVNGAIDPVSTARQIERILSKGGRVTGRTGLAPA